jgi:phage shock protein PspC (stress-responsive transcriptional regulator)
VVRLIALLVTFFYPVTLLVYLVLMLVIPEEPYPQSSTPQNETKTEIKEE